MRWSISLTGVTIGTRRSIHNELQSNREVRAGAKGMTHSSDPLFAFGSSSSRNLMGSWREFHAMNRSLLLFAFAVGPMLFAAPDPARASVSAESHVLDEAGLDVYFQTVCVEKDELVLVRAASGAKMPAQIGTGEILLTGPGERLVVPLGQTFHLFNRQSGIRFVPLPQPLEKKGYLVTLYHRRAAAAPEEQSAMLIINPRPHSKETTRLVPIDSEPAKKLIESAPRR